MKAKKREFKPLFTEQDLVEANREAKKISRFFSKDFIMRLIDKESETRALMRHFNIDSNQLYAITNKCRKEIDMAKKSIFAVDYIPLKPKISNKKHKVKYEKGTGNIVHTYKGVKFYEFLKGNYRRKNGLKSVYEVIGDDKQFNSLEEIHDHILSNCIF